MVIAKNLKFQIFAKINNLRTSILKSVKIFTQFAKIGNLWNYKKKLKMQKKIAIFVRN